MILVILIAGIRYPGYTVISGLTYSLGRFFMAYGYLKSVDKRLPGNVCLNLSLGTLFVMSTLTLTSLN